MLFIVIHQVYELWFKQVLHELDATMRALDRDDLLRVGKHFRRIHTIQRLLEQQVDILETMTPQEFNQFRDNLNPASGFQSVQFRELEFACGIAASRAFAMGRTRRRAACPTRPTRGGAVALRPRQIAAGSPRVRNRFESGTHRELPPHLHRRGRKLRSLLAARGADRIRRAVFALARPSRPHGRTNDRPEAWNGRLSSGRAILEGTLAHRFFPELWEVRTYLGEGTVRNERNLANRPPAILPIGASSFRFSRARRIWSTTRWVRPRSARATALEQLLGRVGRRRPRGVGTLAASHRRDRRRHRRDRRSAAGIVLLGAERLGIASRDRYLHRFQRRAQRGRLRIAAVSVADLCLARVGALTAPSSRIVGSDDGRTIPTERIVEAITETHRDRGSLPRLLCVGRVADVRAIQAHCRRVGALLCVDAYQTTGVYPYDVTEWDLDLVTGGSHKWLCGGPGCGWIYVKPALLERFRPAVTGWMAHARPFAFEAAPIVHASSMYRFGHGTPTIPGYMVAQPGHSAISSIGVARIRERNVALTRADRRNGARALANGQLAARARTPDRVDRDRLRGIGGGLSALDRASASSSIIGRVAAFASGRISILPRMKSTSSSQSSNPSGAGACHRQRSATMSSMIVDHTRIGAAFRRLSIPVAVQMIGDQLLGIVDTIAIGSMGAVALAGATAANTIFIASRSPRTVSCSGRRSLRLSESAPTTSKDIATYGPRGRRSPTFRRCLRLCS